jgi:hypothetical protein
MRDIGAEEESISELKIRSLHFTDENFLAPGETPLPLKPTIQKLCA